MPLSKDPEKRSKSLDALKNNRAEKPNQSHGVQSFISTGIHPCNHCVKSKVCDRYKKDAHCSYLAELRNNVENLLIDIEFIDEQDYPLVQILSKEMAIVALCEMYFSEAGIVIHDKCKKSLSSQPLIQTYVHFLRSAKQTMAALGIGPSARTKLNLEKVSVVKQMEELGMDTEDHDSLEFLK